MYLEWMREYRDVVEKLIKYCNYYAQSYKDEKYYGTEIPISFAQVQVLEYLLENEERHQNMSEIASRLGIRISNFSKIVNKLVDKNLLEKYHVVDNKKDVIVKVTDYGRKIYLQYVDTICDYHFKAMFEVADQIPKEYLPLIASMLEAGSARSKAVKDEKEKELIPICRK